MANAAVEQGVEEDFGGGGKGGDEFDAGDDACIISSIRMIHTTAWSIPFRDTHSRNLNCETRTIRSLPRGRTAWAGAMANEATEKCSARRTSVVGGWPGLVRVPAVFVHAFIRMKQRRP